ncbi:MAG: sulfite reductase subunit alpha [Alphaproteobacteria bacterium]|nr:MAG: sulfite reductase subunit alpha [Alphaproteobacteria bacterium]
MTQPTRPPIRNLVPDNAPFTPEQRTWLNGFFAGFLELGNAGISALSPEANAALMPGLVPAAKGPLDDADAGQAPWQLVERMKLAEGRPLRWRMMAAMGQQDCGQCGYNCEDYSNVVFLRKEERLNLCVPGGKETARTLKTLYKELDEAPPAGETTSPSRAATLADRPALAAMPAERGRSRDNPVEVMIHSRTRLSKPGSGKQTWHLEFDLNGSGLDYAVGDTFGIYPTNDLALVDAVIKAIDAPPDFPIGGRTLRAVLQDSVSLGLTPDILFQLISYITGGERRQKAKALAAGEDPDGDAATLDVLAAIQKFPGIRPDPEAFIESLDALQPRLYSIASSLKTNPGRVALTVDAVHYDINGRTRLGVASTFLTNRIEAGQRIKAYVQKAQAFALPADPAVPIIMIGPGTGIAPFRAFLHERMAMKAPGRNWLFFGHQRHDYDFFYEDELTGMKAAGALTRLSLAWSRDGEEKFYVQDRMRQVGGELWSWIAEGAHIYVCGAITMGKDVERALVDLVAAHGARTIDQAIAFVADLKKKGRYQQDVY